MVDSPRYWLALHPDIRKPIGGAKQMHRLAEALNANGRDARLIQETADFHPGWFQSQVQTIALSDWKKHKDLNPKRDIIILPETFLPVITKYQPGIPKLLFNQNGAYSFGFQKGDGFPDDTDQVLKLYRHPDLIHVLCVSRHDQKLLESAFCLGAARVSRLINPIETKTFFPGQVKKKIISYMPRKNSRDAGIVSTLLKQKPLSKGWSLQPIHGLPQNKVAELLQKSLGFLSFGHPEGFGLPLAEAGACGCAIIGYSGLGGRELIDIANKHKVCWNVEYGDWQGFINGVEALISRTEEDPQKLAVDLQNLSKEIRKQYSWNAMVESVAAALPRWESNLTK